MEGYFEIHIFLTIVPVLLMVNCLSPPFHHFLPALLQHLILPTSPSVFSPILSYISLSLLAIPLLFSPFILFLSSFSPLGSLYLPLPELLLSCFCNRQRANNVWFDIPFAGFILQFVAICTIPFTFIYASLCSAFTQIPTLLPSFSIRSSCFSKGDQL